MSQDELFPLSEDDYDMEDVLPTSKSLASNRRLPSRDSPSQKKDYNNNNKKRQYLTTSKSSKNSDDSDEVSELHQITQMHLQYSLTPNNEDSSKFKKPSSSTKPSSSSSSSQGGEYLKRSLPSSFPSFQPLSVNQSSSDDENITSIKDLSLTLGSSKSSTPNQSFSKKSNKKKNQNPTGIAKSNHRPSKNNKASVNKSNMNSQMSDDSSQFGGFGISTSFHRITPTNQRYSNNNNSSNFSQNDIIYNNNLEYNEEEEEEYPGITPQKQNELKRQTKVLKKQRNKEFESLIQQRTTSNDLIEENEYNDDNNIQDDNDDINENLGNEPIADNHQGTPMIIFPIDESVLEDPPVDPYENITSKKRSKPRPKEKYNNGLHAILQDYPLDPELETTRSKFSHHFANKGNNLDYNDTNIQRMHEADMNTHVILTSRYNQLTEIMKEHYANRFVRLQQRWILQCDPKDYIGWCTFAFQVVNYIVERDKRVSMGQTTDVHDALQRQLGGPQNENENVLSNNNNANAEIVTVPDAADMLKAFQSESELIGDTYKNYALCVDWTKKQKRALMFAFANIWKNFTSCFKSIGVWYDCYAHKYLLGDNNAPSRVQVLYNMYAKQHNKDYWEYDPFTKLKMYVLEFLANCRFARGMHADETWVFSEVISELQYSTYYWKPIMSLDDFILEICKKEVTFEMYQILCAKGMRARLIEQLETNKETEFPDVNPLRGFYSFKNGIIDIYRTRWIRYGSESYIDLPAGFQTYLYFDSLFDDSDWIEERQVFAGADHPELYKAKLIDDLATVQGWSAQETEHYYFHVGRVLFPNGYDGFVIMVHHVGFTRSGKSTSCKIVAGFYPVQRIANLSSDGEANFPLYTVIDKKGAYIRDILINYEVRKQGGLPVAVFLSVVANDPQSINRKFLATGQVMDFPLPLVSAGNDPWQYYDISGAVKMRTYYISYKKPYPSGEKMDMKNIRKHAASTMKKALLTYRKIYNKAKETNNWNYWSYAPESAKKLSDDYHAHDHILFNFINNNYLMYIDPEVSGPTYIKADSLSHIFWLFMKYEMESNRSIRLPRDSEWYTTLLLKYPQTKHAIVQKLQNITDYQGKLHPKETVFICNFLPHPDKDLAIQEWKVKHEAFLLKNGQAYTQD